MYILCVRTDKPDAELYLYNKTEFIDKIIWEAHRMLAETLHSKIELLLNSSEIKIEQITGIVFYKGPGSFTGLRIGASVCGALAYSVDGPVSSTNGNEWINEGIDSILGGEKSTSPVIEYGQPVHITQQKK